MKPAGHIIISLSLGTAVWFFTRSLLAGVICFLSGFLLDIDHALQYVICYGWRDFSFTRCYQVCEQTARKDGERRFKKIHLIFHGIEIALLLWLVTLYTRNLYIFAAALGYSAHIIIDSIVNPFHLRFYSIAWRALNKFDVDRFWKN